MRIPPVPGHPLLGRGLDVAISCLRARVAAVLALLWYLRVIVLPAVIALTVAPALTPLARWLRTRVGRPAAAMALTVGIIVVAGLIALVTTSVVAEYDELRDSVSSGVDDVTGWLEGEPFNLSLEGGAWTLDSSLGSGLESSRPPTSSSGLSTGVALITGLVLAVALLYFILRDGSVLWRWIVDRFSAETRAVDRSGRADAPGGCSAASCAARH